MNKQVLHIAVIELCPGKGLTGKRLLLHAYIELGTVTELRCQYDQCVMTTREFVPGQRGRGTLSFDHVIPLEHGGSDLPENIRILHFACNSARAANEYSDERREKISAASRRRWQDPAYREQMVEMMAQKSADPEIARSKSEKMRAHWADPEKRATHTARLARGDAWKRGRE